MSEYLVDPSLRITWRNNPSPLIPETYLKELHRIGGDAPNGLPLLRFEWGQSALQWFRGKWRIKYRDMRIPAQEHVQFTRVKTTPRKKAGRKPKVETRVYSTLDEALNDDWGIFSLKREFEFIGKPLFYVARWHPAEEKGDPETWERTRYRPAYDAELGYMPKCDMLGEYPSKGFYEEMLVAGEYRGEHTESGAAILHYRPIDSDVLEDVRQKMQEIRTAPKFDAAQFIRDWYAKDEEDTKKEADEEHYRRMDVAKTAYHMEAKDRVFNSKE